MSSKAESRPHVQAVLFDYGMVLSAPPEAGAWKQMHAIFEVEEPGFHSAYWMFRSDYDRGSVDGPRYWEAVAGALHKPLLQSQIDGLLSLDVQLWTQPNQRMIAWVESLQDAGVRTGILSNLGGDMETGIRAQCPWLESFTHRTFSHRLGVTKPDAQIYRYAADGLGVASSAVLFVDDKKENVEGAVRVGMQALLYDSHTQFVRDFRQAGYDRELPAPPT